MFSYCRWLSHQSDGGSVGIALARWDLFPSTCWNLCLLWPRAREKTQCFAGTPRYQHIHTHTHTELLSVCVCMSHVAPSFNSSGHLTHTQPNTSLMLQQAPSGLIPRRHGLTPWSYHPQSCDKTMTEVSHPCVVHQPELGLVSGWSGGIFKI